MINKEYGVRIVCKPLSPPSRARSSYRTHPPVPARQCLRLLLVSMNRCCCLCGSRRYRERPGRLDSSASSMPASGGAPSSPDDCCCLWSWLSSALSWDWLPLGTSDSANGGVAGGGDGRSGRRRESLGAGDVGGASVLEGVAGGGGAGMRRVPATEDSKPLLVRVVGSLVAVVEMHAIFVLPFFYSSAPMHRCSGHRLS